MHLPKIQTPEFKDKLKLSKIDITYRPFLVSEEKILLMAIEGFDGKDSSELIEAVKKIIKNCILRPVDLDINTLPNVDVEWLFLQIRKRTLGEQIELNIIHDKEGCGEHNKVKVNLKNTTIVIPEHSNIIKLTETAGITLKYPQFGSSMTLIDETTKASAALVYKLIAENIDSVYDGDNFAKASEYSTDDLIAWIDTWSPTQLQECLKFFNELPYISTPIKYVCNKCKDVVELEVKGTTDFFT